MDTPYPNITVEAATEPQGGSPALAATGCGDVVAPPTGNTGGKLWTYTDQETGECFLLCPTKKDSPEVSLVSFRSESTSPYAAITDYLNCTFRFNPEHESLEKLFQELFGLLGPKFAPALDRQRRFNFYGRSFSLGETGAILGIGGQAGTVLVSIPGEACSLIQNWKSVVSYFETYRHARITRWDGAVDDFEGQHTVDICAELYLANQFNSGGNKPRADQKGNWLIPDGNGRTFNVGRRENGKMLRVYEKGMQLGWQWHPWVRWEIELHNTDRVVPWDVLLNPGQYFVGAYPKALGWAQSEMCRIKTVQRQQTVSYEHLIGCASAAYGPLINVMLEVESNQDAVIQKLIRPGIPKRLRHPLVDRPSGFINAKSVGEQA